MFLDMQVLVVLVYVVFVLLFAFFVVLLEIDVVVEECFVFLVGLQDVECE